MSERVEVPGKTLSVNVSTAMPTSSEPSRRADGVDVASEILSSKGSTIIDSGTQAPIRTSGGPDAKSVNEQIEYIYGVNKPRRIVVRGSFEQYVGRDS